MFFVPTEAKRTRSGRHRSSFGVYVASFPGRWIAVTELAGTALSIISKLPAFDAVAARRAVPHRSVHDMPQESPPTTEPNPICSCLYYEENWSRFFQRQVKIKSYSEP